MKTPRVLSPKLVTHYRLLSSPHHPTMVGIELHAGDEQQHFAMPRDMLEMLCRQARDLLAAEAPPGRDVH